MNWWTIGYIVIGLNVIVQFRGAARRPEITRWLVLTMLFAACLLLAGIFGTLRSNLVIVVRCPSVQTTAIHVPAQCP